MQKGKIVIRKFIVSIVVFMSFFSFSAWADTFNVNVQIIIRQPISIAFVDFLDFGLIEAQAGATTYTISNAIASATPQTSGTGSVVDGNSAEYTASGDANASVVVSLNTTGPLVVGPVTYNLTLNPSGTTTLNGSGSLTVLVGGTANVSAGPASGTYANASTFILEVIYQ